VIEIKELSKSFGKRRVLRNINLKIRPGQITAVAGPNACGKTTLMKCIVGLSHPDSGQILLEGRPLDPAGEFRRALGYMPQDADFPENLKVEELFSMLEGLRREPGKRLDELISYFELGDFLRQPIGRLSGGTRQKVAAVSAFQFDARLVLLDEPTAGMDPIVSLRLKNLLKEEAKKGKTIVLVSHLMTEVEQLAEEIVFLDEGEAVFAGPIASLLSDTESTSLEPALTRLFERKRGRA
jgi:Cu-processing system ATP-binding protein